MRFSNIPAGVGYALLIVVSIFLAFLNVAVHPFAAFGVIIGGCIFYIAVRSPFFLLMCFIVFQLGRGADFFPILGQIGAGKYFALSAMGILVLSKLFNRDLTIVRTPFNRWMILLTITVLISSFLGTDPDASIEFFKEEFMKSVILFFLIVNIVATKKQLTIFQFCVVGVCVFFAGYASLAQILGEDPLTGAALVEGSRSGGVGAMNDPNDLAMLILISIPFSTVGLIEGKGKLRLLFFLLFAIAISGVLSTQSRGGLIGLTVGFALVLNKYIKNKILLLSLSAILIIVVTVAAGISDRQVAADYDNGFDESSQGRLDAWHAGMRMLIKNPVIGVGFVQFPFNYLDYAENPVICRPLEAHNTYIQIAAELGVSGIVCFFLLLYMSIKNATLMGRKSKTESKDLARIIQISAFPSYIAFLIAAVFLSSGYYGIMYVMFASFAISYNIFELHEIDSAAI